MGWDDPHASLLSEYIIEIAIKKFLELVTREGRIFQE